MRPHALTVSSLLVAGVIAAAPAPAREAGGRDTPAPDAATPAAAGGAVTLDEISVQGAPESPPGLQTVTRAGSRLPMTVMETPASVDVISGETMRDRGQASLQQAIARDATGVTFIGEPGDGASAMSMRGFTGAQAITRLYDGVRLYAGGGAITFPFDTWTVERVEVLHGPASALHGEGAIGGAINVIPRKPMFDGRRNEVMATTGSFGMFGLAGGSAGPVGASAAYTVDVAGRGSRGWMERGDARSLALSGALAWKPADDLQLTLSQDYGHDEPSGYFATPLVNGALLSSLRKRNFNIADNILRFQDSITQLHARWTPSDTVEINARAWHVTGERNWRNAENYTWLPGSANVLRNDYIAIRHSVAQTGTRLDGALRATLAGMQNTTSVGLELEHVRFRKRDNSPYPGESVTPLFGGAPGFFGAYAMQTTVDARTWRYALFADNRLQVSDKVSLIGGLRFDAPRLDRDNPATGAHAAATLDSLNWRLGAVWNPRPDVAVYAQYAKASEPVTSVLGFSDAVKDMRLPVGEQIETGVKFMLPGGRGEATLAAYHITRRNMLSRDPADYSVVRQIGRQSSRGVEARLGLAVTDTLRVDASGALLRARYDRFVQPDGDFTGATPANTPQQTASLWVTWRFMEHWRLTAGLQYVGRTYANDANTVTRPAYTVVNAGLSWRPAPYARLDLTVENLFDAIYASSGAAHHSAAASMWRLGPPRAVTLALRMSF
ncbi:TonB-dependent receptor [Camelimonas abortus]|uniref:TonB-dependent receptor n=1 Tax=Camelimonas abortus TaxID=1017184 RepID=A0ABV7LFK0_9HYPH